MKATAAIFAAAETYCAAVMAGLSFMLSMQMRDIDPELSPKASSIRNYLPEAPEPHLRPIWKSWTATWRGSARAGSEPDRREGCRGFGWHLPDPLASGREPDRRGRAGDGGGYRPGGRGGEGGLPGLGGSLRRQDRKQVLHLIADGIEARAEEIALCECWDTGQAWRFMSKAALRGAENFRFFADMAPGARDGRTLHSPDHLNVTSRRPIGPVGVITPWNTPFMLSTWKIAPALAAGCTVVHKPAEFCR